MKPVFTKEQILSAFEKRTASIIFSYGAFDIFGLACLIGDYALQSYPRKGNFRQCAKSDFLLFRYSS